MSKATVKLGGITVPVDLSHKELLKFLVENKSLLIAEKKAAIKEADGIPHVAEFSAKYFIDKEGKLAKAANNQQPSTGGPETVLCVINTTNWMDSHSDVHIPGIWNKSLKDNKAFIHLQEHNMGFAYVISDESKGYTEKLTWKELGLDLAGVTEALIFSTPLKGRNPYMEDQYRKGFVKNHSVGMRYVTIKLCINDAEDEYYKEEYANWVQYAPMVANIADAEAQGFFWAVLEAKIIEGSAVVKGSNIITPTMGFKSAQPEGSTGQQQPDVSTVVKDANADKGVNWDKIANNLNFLTT
jgi:hypothetical protein